MAAHGSRQEKEEQPVDQMEKQKDKSEEMSDDMPSQSQPNSISDERELLEDTDDSSGDRDERREPIFSSSGSA